jgi:hypothetical protein
VVQAAPLGVRCMVLPLKRKDTYRSGCDFGTRHNELSS